MENGFASPVRVSESTARQLPGGSSTGSLQTAGLPVNSIRRRKVSADLPGRLTVSRASQLPRFSLPTVTRSVFFPARLIASPNEKSA